MISMRPSRKPQPCSALGTQSLPCVGLLAGSWTCLVAHFPALSPGGPDQVHPLTLSTAPGLVSCGARNHHGGFGLCLTLLSSQMFSLITQLCSYSSLLLLYFHTTGAAVQTTRKCLQETSMDEGGGDGECFGDG